MFLDLKSASPRYPFKKMIAAQAQAQQHMHTITFAMRHAIKARAQLHTPGTVDGINNQSAGAYRTRPRAPDPMLKRHARASANGINKSERGTRRSLFLRFNIGLGVRGRASLLWHGALIIYSIYCLGFGFCVSSGCPVD